MEVQTTFSRANMGCVYLEVAAGVSWRRFGDGLLGAGPARRAVTWGGAPRAVPR